MPENGHAGIWTEQGVSLRFAAHHGGNQSNTPHSSRYVAVNGYAGARKDFGHTMKIIHFIATNFIGGPEKQILSHLLKAGESGHEWLVLSFEEGGGRELQKKCGQLDIRCKLLPADRMSVFPVLRGLVSIYRREKPSLICAHGYKANFYTLALKMITGCRIVGFSRGWTAEDFTVRMYGLMDKLLIRFSDRVVAVSFAQAERLAELFVPRRKIRVIQNSLIDLESDPSPEPEASVRGQLGLGAGSRLILSAGRLSPEKGHSDLLTAASLILVDNARADVHFVFAGDGPLEEKLKARAKELNIADHVHFLGFCRNVKPLFRQCDIFALPSLSEGLPNVILEALFFKLAVAATRVGGVPELIEDGQTGMLVAPGNPQDMAEKIMMILDSAALAKRITLAGFERVNREFSRDRQTQLLLDVYREVAEK